VRWLAIVGVLGCFHYEPGSFGGDRAWPGRHIALACLDLAVQVGRDETVTGPVVAYALGNRCDHDVEVDLGSARVVARDAVGRDLQLSAFDPRHEIRALPLPALFTGEAHIEYNGDFAEKLLVQICIDIGGIDRSEPFVPHWECFGDRLEPSR
jgi:hypothetical protein